MVPLLSSVEGQHTEHATCSQQRLLIHFPRIPTITHRSSLMTYNLEENYKNASTHFSFSHTSTMSSVWNNYRDQEVEFDWQTYVPTVTGLVNTHFFTSHRQQKQFFLQLEIRMRIVCVLKKSQSRLQQQPNQDF